MRTQESWWADLTVGERIALPFQLLLALILAGGALWFVGFLLWGLLTMAWDALRVAWPLAGVVVLCLILYPSMKRAK